jgi:hypothetical protein
LGSDLDTAIRMGTRAIKAKNHSSKGGKIKNKRAPEIPAKTQSIYLLSILSISASETCKSPGNRVSFIQVSYFLIWY